jgi:DNA-binding NarL/FixJ family response regulator
LKRVLVFQSDQLLLAGVESLLAREMDMNVSTITLSDGNQLISEIEQFEPEVVVMDENLVLSRFSLILDLFRGFPELRVMVVDDKENLLHIYDKHEVTVRQGKDLVSAIRHSNGLSGGKTSRTGSQH